MPGPREIDSDITKIFEHWKRVMNHPRARLDSARRRAITARLRDGYSAEDIIKAIDGCRASRWHMGDNPSGVRYDDLTLICRNGAKLEQFQSYLDAKPAKPAWIDVGRFTNTDDRIAQSSENNVAPTPNSPLPCYICGGRRTTVYKKNGTLLTRPCHRCTATP